MRDDEIPDSLKLEQAPHDLSKQESELLIVIVINPHHNLSQNDYCNSRLQFQPRVLKTQHLQTWIYNEFDNGEIHSILESLGIRNMSCVKAGH